MRLPALHWDARWAFAGVMFVAIFGYFKVSPLGAWDEMFYWAQLTSLWHDGDLLLHDDLLAGKNLLPEKYRALTMLNSQGELPNTFAIGTCVIDGAYAGPWVRLNSYLGLPRLTEKLLRWVAIISVFKIWMLLSLLWALSSFYSPFTRLTFVPALTAFLGTPILHYAFRDYGMSHLNSTLCTSFFVYLLLRWMEASTFSVSFALGLAAGFLVLSRWQNVTYVLLVPPPVLHRILVSKEGRMPWVWGILIAAGAASFIVSLQSIAWFKQFGSPLLLPQGEGFMNWSSPAWMNLLFSGYHGLLTWSPVVALGALGLLWGAVRKKGYYRWLLIGALLTLTATVYINACVEDWWGGGSYGARRFCAMLPLFVLGLVELLAGTRRIWGIVLLLAILAWAHFTSTCYLNRIDDLSVALLDRTSEGAPNSMGDYWIRDGKMAKEVLADKLPDPQFSAVKLLGLKSSKTLDRIGSTLLIFAAMVAALTAVTGLKRMGRSFRIVVIALTVYPILVLVVLLSLPATYNLNKTWQDYTARHTAPQQAIAAGIPREAVAFVEAVKKLQHGDEIGAARILEQVDITEFPQLEIDAVRAVFGNTEPTQH